MEFVQRKGSHNENLLLVHDDEGGQDCGPDSV